MEWRYLEAQPIFNRLEDMTRYVETMRTNVADVYAYTEFRTTEIQQFRRQLQMVFEGLQDIQASLLPPEERFIVMSLPRVQPETGRRPIMPISRLPRLGVEVCWYPTHTISSNAVKCHSCGRAYCKAHGLSLCLFCGNQLW